MIYAKRVGATDGKGIEKCNLDTIFRVTRNFWYVGCVCVSAI